MAVGIADNLRLEIGARLGDEYSLRGLKPRHLRPEIVHDKLCVPEHEVVCFGIIRQWASSRRRDIFQKLYARSALHIERRDAQSRAENLIQVFLLYAVIVRPTCNAKAKLIAVERKTLVRVVDDDCRCRP